VVEAHAGMGECGDYRGQAASCEVDMERQETWA
jgi:hypothetical protein